LSKSDPLFLDRPLKLTHSLIRFFLEDGDTLNKWLGPFSMEESTADFRLAVPV
jgi:hypothetical protein